MIFFNENASLFNGTLTNKNIAVDSGNNIDIFHPVSSFWEILRALSLSMKNFRRFMGKQNRCAMFKFFHVQQQSNVDLCSASLNNKIQSND